MKSDHLWRFYDHFSDFSPVAFGDTLKSSRWTWKIEFWQENIGIELLKTKSAWKLVKFVIQQDLFELHPSIFEDSMAISLFWHILVILQTSEKSLKWPLRLQKWSDFTLKKRKMTANLSLIEWAIVIYGVNWIFPGQKLTFVSNSGFRQSTNPNPNPQYLENANFPGQTALAHELSY